MHRSPGNFLVNMDVPPRRSFLLGAATNWFAFAATLAVSFFLTPYLIDSLGKARYDVWCVVESVLAYFTLLDMGVAACLVRYVAKHHVTADREGLNRLASSCLAVFVLAGCAAMVLGLPVLFAMSDRLDAKAGGTGDVLPFMLLMLANLAMSLPLSVFPSILDGLERYPEKSLVRVIFLLIRTAGIVVVVNTQSGLMPLGIVYTVVTFAENVTFAGLCFRYLPGLKFAWVHVDRATLKEVRGYSTDAFLAMLAGRITVQTGAILVGLFLPAGQVTYFATAARLVEYAKTLLRTITATLTPGVSAMEARGDHAGIAKLFLHGTRWMLYLVLPVNIGLWCFGKAFLAKWVGPDFVDGSFPTVAILALTLSLGVAQSVASRILYGLGKLKLFARVALIEAVLNIALTAALILPFGVEGVAVAVAVPNVLFCLFVLAYTMRTLNVTARDYLLVWVRPVLVSVIPLTVWLLWGEVSASWVEIGTAIGAGLVPYAGGVALCEWISRTNKWNRYTDIAAIRVVSSSTAA